MSRVPKILTNLPRLSKSDRGAILFQTVFNQLTASVERIDANILELARSQHEYKRRLSALEEAVKTHRKTLFPDNQGVRMFCIACHYEFSIPVQEAEDPEFVTTCPKCHHWSLPMGESEPEYTTAEIAEMTGFSYSFICQVIRELGLRKGRELQSYHEEEIQQIKAFLSTKKRGGNHDRNTANQG